LPDVRRRLEGEPARRSDPGPDLDHEPDLPIQYLTLIRGSG